MAEMAEVADVADIVQGLPPLPALRLQGWEARLLAVVAEARTRPYALGEHDCFSLACAAVAALTGVDRWPAFAGRYRTRREALVLLARHGRSFTDAGASFFGAPPVTWKLARRGDILEFVDAGGEHHLALCMGTHAVVLGEQGLMDIRVGACRHAWRIG